MWFRVEPRLPKPVYQQVVDGIKESIAKGLIGPGEKLPSVRDLALEMTLNPNTVAKAYRELEHARVIEVVRGRGTYAAGPGPIPDREERMVRMRDTVRELIVDAHYLQLKDEELMTFIQDALQAWKDERGGDAL